MSKLPTFRYHPDPIATGSVVASSGTCLCCGRARGYLYKGPTYCVAELDDCICPWCIADGSAHRKFDLEFVGWDDVGGHEGDLWEAVPRSIADEVAQRTPGFCGWQQERWWSHCADAAAFIGMAGAKEVLAQGAATIEHLRRDLGWEKGQDFEDYIRSLNTEGDPTAYLFRCLHCGEVGGYSDFL